MVSIFRTSVQPLTGTKWNEIMPKARKILRAIEARTKRRPYVRSVYFHKDKIFVSYFLKHLLQKHHADRVRRIRYLPCALDLIRSSCHDPLSKEHDSVKDCIVHRFFGITKDNEYFCVQIKASKRSGRKEFLSAFPIKNPPPGGSS